MNQFGYLAVLALAIGGCSHYVESAPANAGAGDASGQTSAPPGQDYNAGLSDTSMTPPSQPGSTVDIPFD